MFLDNIQEPTRNENIALGTSSIVLSEARNEIKPRKTIMIRNISEAGQIVTINFGFNKAENNKGIVLKQNEAVTDSTEAGYQCFQGVISGISSGANAKITIFER